jgi:hypothetical protein
MALDPKPVKKCEIIKLKSLVSFPTQNDNFPACTAEEDISLREDIAATGLRDLIHVLPDNAAGLPCNTVMIGHRRHQALLDLGHTEYKVWVRYDLAGLTRPELERLFLADNFHRRQLSKLDKARIAMRLFEIEKKRKPGELREAEEREARNRVGKLIGMSGRSL